MNAAEQKIHARPITLQTFDKTMIKPWGVVTSVGNMEHYMGGGFVYENYLGTSAHANVKSKGNLDG